MSLVWEHSQQSGSSLLVLLALADFADDDGYCYPSVARLAKKARLSERATQYALRDLEEAGELSVERGGGRRKANRYKVQTLRHIPLDTVQDVQDNPRDMAHDLHPLKEETPQPVRRNQRKGAKYDRKTVQPIAPEPSLRTVNTPPASDDAGSDVKPYDLFAAFCDELGTDPHVLDNQSLTKQLGKAKELIRRDVSVDEVRAYTGFLMSLSWRDKPIDMFTVADGIAAWRLNGRPASSQTRAAPPGQRVQDLYARIDMNGTNQ